MRRVFRLLDSKLLVRVSALVTVATLGFALVGLMRIQGAGLVQGIEGITLLCFGIWAVLIVMLIVSWMARRQPSMVASPVAHIAISKGVPGSSRALLAALVRSESAGREFIADAATLMPVNNQRAAYELAQAYVVFEDEVASLVEGAKEFDERWSLTWARKPSWFRDNLLKGPFTLGMLSELVRYMALRNRQLGWMIDFLQGGSDEPVRFARAWAREAERSADTARAA